MKTIIAILVLSLAVVSVSCQKEESQPADVKPVQLTEKQQQVVNHSNSFGFDLFRKVYEVSEPGKNLMVSSLSVSMALGMTRNGAAGTTLDAMNTVLGFGGMTDSEVNESYKYLLETFSGLDPNVKINVANSIWYRNTFTVEQSFIDVNLNYFGAEVNAVDFDDPGTVGLINDWVSDKTNQLIPRIINEIPAEMVMYLINAVYFKGQWKYQFDKSKTEDRAFALADGTTVQAPGMLQEAGLNYYKGDGFGAVELPYNQGNFLMTVMLPDAGNTLEALIDQFTPENWAAWQNQMALTDIRLQLPKFKFPYEEKKMTPVLASLGMGVAFDPDYADFTRINRNGGLYISEVRHKTFIENNEEGTEAAAVTSVGVAVTTIGNDPQPVSFIVDRPFLFVISEKTTGAILFAGVLNNPNQDS